MDNSFNYILEQAKNLKSKLNEKQQDLAQLTFTGEAGAGMVKITVNGLQKVMKIDIDDALYQEPKTVLQDLLVSAFNAAQEKFKANSQQDLAQLAANLDLGKFMDQ